MAEQTPYEKLSAEAKTDPAKATAKEAVDVKVDATLGAMKGMLSPEQLKATQDQMRNAIAGNPKTLEGVVADYKLHQTAAGQAQPKTHGTQAQSLTPEQQKALDAAGKAAGGSVTPFGTEDDRMKDIKKMLKDSGATHTTGGGASHPAPGAAAQGKAKPPQEPASGPTK